MAKIVKVPEGAKVLRWWSDNSVQIEWIDEKSGERVVGEFVFGLWAWAPPKLRKEVEDTMLSSPPVAIYRGRRER